MLRDMLSALVLTVSLSAVPSGRSAVLLSDAPLAHGARLFAQAPPPLPVRPPDAQPVGTRALQLEAEIQELNAQLREVNVGWPAGAIAMAVIGWVVSPAALVGLLLLLVAAIEPALLFPAVVVTIIGLGGVALGIAGIVTGVGASTRAKLERDELVARRRQLEEELRSVRGSPGGVNRSFEASPRLITLASF
jgi:hypothetical protein